MINKTLIIVLLAQAFGVSCTHSAKEFVTVDAPIIALTHIRVIDGTGAPAKEDQTIIIEQGRIKSVSSGANTPANAKVLDLSGRTAIPGLVGMHEHLFYTTDAGRKDVAANVSFARLYLASGVTTIRTAGTLSFENDLTTKRLVDKGEWAGPKIHLTSLYLNHPTGSFFNLEDLSKQINGFADDGATSLKIYTNVTRSELGAIIAIAHRRSLIVTGHLCAVGFRDAIAAGIDNLEHGLIVDTEFYSAKRPDECPDRSNWLPELVSLDVNGPKVKLLISELVSHHVAVTSTLPIFETFLGERFKIDPRVHEVLSPEAYAACLSQIEHDQSDPRWPQVWQVMFKHEMEFEREFVKAGGLLLAGVDPTGWGGVVAGFGDQRGIELLVQAGFTPLEAIRIATANGAQFLGAADVGTLVAGKQADIVIVRGNPLANVSDVKNVETVFKDGIGYDSAKLIASVKGQVGKE